MPLYDFACPVHGGREEYIWFTDQTPPLCNCGKEMERLFPGNQMIKMKGEGGYPSRRKQIFNTDKYHSPKLT